MTGRPVQGAEAVAREAARLRLLLDAAAENAARLLEAVPA